MKYLFGTGTARGGTGILVQTLSAHSKIEYALDPCLQIFKDYRNIVAKSLLGTEEFESFDLNSPISDYYFENEGINFLNTLLSSNLNFPFDDTKIPELIQKLIPRTRLDNEDLIPHLSKLEGKSIKTLLESFLRIIFETRGNQLTNYCGIHENWIIDFFPALAQTFPDSKFFVVIRDPRSVQASHLAVKDALRTSQLTFLRGLRKLYDLTLYYSSLEMFKGRLMVVPYENLIRSPKDTAEEICQFLEIEFEEDMINPEKHFIPGTKVLRDGVSSFEKNAAGYNTSRIERWKSHLNFLELYLIEELLFPEMEHFAYSRVTARQESGMDMDAIQSMLEKENREFTFKWRTDSVNLDLELKNEIERKSLLRLKEPKIEKINLAFYNTEIFEKLKGYSLTRN